MDAKRIQLRRGVLVFIALAVLTGIEYAVAVSTRAYYLLVLAALIKAGLVAWYYMHIRSVFSGSGDHE